MRIIISRPWGFAAPKIMRGFTSAFRDMGHDVYVLRPHEIITPKQAQEEFRNIIEFAPDIALGYGFSALVPIESTHLFSWMNVPTIHYFADDPFHPGTRRDIALVARDTLSSIWLWDESYIAPLRDAGIKNVHHLPLAADPKVFRKLDPDDYEKIEYQCYISFAGNGDILTRLPYLEKVADLGLVIFGDRQRWRKHASASPVFSCYRGFLKEDRELCELYNTAKINLNVTAGQGKASANLRVFNIAASAGFLLSDYKDGIASLFEIGTEIACYRTPEELRRMALYYLEHPHERKRMADAAYSRVLRDHTYRHRAAVILDYVREKYRKTLSMATT